MKLLLNGSPGTVRKALRSNFHQPVPIHRVEEEVPRSQVVLRSPEARSDIVGQHKQVLIRLRVLEDLFDNPFHPGIAHIASQRTS